MLTLVSCSEAAGQQNLPSQIIGSWKGTNEEGRPVRIEFTSDGEYLVSVDNNTLTVNIMESGAIKYKILNDSIPLRIALYGEKDQASFGQLVAEFPSGDQLELIPLDDEELQEMKDLGIRLMRF